MPVVIPSGSNEILFVTPESASLDFRFDAGNRTGSGIMGKWEIDPDDGQSLQFRIPKEKFGGNTDRVAFYVSASGKIGIGTKDPEEAFDVRDMAEDVAETTGERARHASATAGFRKKLFQASRTEENQVISGSLKGNAATATKLATARNIGGVSFDGSANINLPGVNTAGNQDTTGNAATATSASYAVTSSMTTGDAASSAKVIVTADDASANHPVTFMDNTTPNGSAESLKASRNITVNPNTGAITLGDLTISFTQGDGRTTFGTITFTALDEAGRLRRATIDLA